MTISCADMMEEAASKHAGVELETRSGKSVTLRSVLLLDEAGLKSAKAILSSFADADEGNDLDKVDDMVPKIRDLLLLIANDAAAMKAEMKDWPVSIYIQVVNEWQEGTQTGEAEPSSE
ncbi:phage tail assembly protein [Streptomyces sp. N2-109]|uniref:Phage tail assembly protein n=1 Tax=Streptomyces gossypii TaxID=2883101 RepID=A0ABT2K223_9ACTN|nr:phage tail assembly protein [Streptomyces gossypii]MCT2594227.1 phage tail assembly protein [Streptomyces gossypii]